MYVMSPDIMIGWNDKKVWGSTEETAEKTVNST